MVHHRDVPAPPAYDSDMAVPNWSPVLSGDRPADHSDVPARHLDRENAALRELVTVYRYLSGLALQDADLAGVVRLISDRTSATVAVLTQLMDVLTAAAPGVSAEKATADVREHLIHPRLGQVLRASRLSRGWIRCSRTSALAFSALTPGAAAVSTSISWVRTATVAEVRSEISRTTPARSASCRASPDRYRYTVTSSRRAAFSRSRCRAGTSSWSAGRSPGSTGDQLGTAMLESYARGAGTSLWRGTKPAFHSLLTRLDWSQEGHGMESVSVRYLTSVVSAVEINMHFNR